jgi:hypothetical protein
MARTGSLVLPNTTNSVRKCLSCDAALQVAWWTWFTLLAIPFILFLAVVWNAMDNDGSVNVTDGHLAQTWFIATMIFMAVGVPAAFFWRSHIFRGYWSGQAVSPRDYLVGMITIWAALEIGGLFALTGCLLTGALLPNLLPALLAFMLFTPLWPNGHSMTRPLTDEHDPADYEDPR